jgi:hypothetical protein
MPAPSDPERYKEFVERCVKASTGRKHTEETKRKIRESKIGPDNPNYGKSPSPETRQKLSHAGRGKKRSDETRQKLSQSKMGENNPNYGKTFSPEEKARFGLRGELNPHFGKEQSVETRKKISDSHKGKTLSDETRRKIGISITGRKHSVETRQRMSDALKGKPKPDGFIKRNSGPNASNWQGGISFGKYCCKFNRAFKENVRGYFSNTCQLCGHIWVMGERLLDVHHVYYNKGACCEVDPNGEYSYTLSGKKLVVSGSPNKFVPLCRSPCHSSTMPFKERYDWAIYFEKLINEKFGGRSYDD